jgi:hypothetical protein
MRVALGSLRRAIDAVFDAKGNSVRAESRMTLDCRRHAATGSAAHGALWER